MFRRISVLALALSAMLLLAPRDADAWRFGTQQSTHVIGETKLKGPNNETLMLGYMTRTEFFLAGLYVKDEGYVLIPVGTSGRYMQMPNAEMVKQLQQAGLLPNPLPRYKLSSLTYLVGYSLWILIAILAVCGIWKHLKMQREAADTSAFDGLNRLPGTTTRLPGAAP